MWRIIFWSAIFLSVLLPYAALIRAVVDLMFVVSLSMFVLGLLALATALREGGQDVSR